MYCQIVTEKYGGLVVKDMSGKRRYRQETEKTNALIAQAKRYCLATTIYKPLNLLNI